MFRMKMFSQSAKKEDAVRIQEQLIKDLGEKEFRRLFDETRRNWIQNVGALPSPSHEDIVLTLNYNLSEEKRKKALEKPSMLKFDFEGIKVDISHDGRHWKVYYFPIHYFETDLQTLGKFLETLEEKHETIIEIIPNLGSVIFGVSNLGVKGFAVITKKTTS